MIVKQVQGSHFRKVLNYVHHKLGAKLLGGNVTGKEPASLAAEFLIAADLRRRLTKCVYHASLSLPAEVEKAIERQIPQPCRSGA